MRGLESFLAFLASNITKPSLSCNALDNNHQFKSASETNKQTNLTKHVTSQRSIIPSNKRKYYLPYALVCNVVKYYLYRYGFVHKSHSSIHPISITNRCSCHHRGCAAIHQNLWGGKHLDPTHSSLAQPPLARPHAPHHCHFTGATRGQA